MTHARDITVALFVGGASSERPVSKMTGRGVYGALLEAGYRVLLIDPAYGAAQPEDPEAFFAEEDFAAIDKRNYLTAMMLPALDDADVAFVGLHGAYGEDGAIQAALELRGLPYAGGGVLACALSMDKSRSKILFRNRGIAVPEGFSVRRNADEPLEALERAKKDFGFPAVVKPNAEGSTFGLTLCKEESQFFEALAFAFRYCDVALVEEYVPGRELTVGVLDGDALTPLEIKPKHEIYDYECKYVKGMSEYVVPAPVSERTLANLKRQALLAYHSIGCRGYARVDFRMREDERHYCLELNPLPGLTETSLLPKMAAAEHISYVELIDRITRSAL